jgi:hypothetical protein
MKAEDVTKEYTYGWLDKVMKVRDIDGMTSSG